MEPSYLQPLRHDDEFILYRGRCPVQPDSLPVLLLAPTSARPPLETLRKIEHEYSLREELDSAWAVRPVAVSEQSGRTTLVLEDPGGETLDQSLSVPLGMPRFLRVAVGIATALSGVHKKGLIHKDVKPANILVNSATGETRLMGFGIASRLPRERQTPEPPEFIAGTLPYMAPEQTGRMNRSIDARSDLYALGVTLYEILTGSLPFSVTDPMELVHCHIARQPVPPGERLKGIPGAVSAIIMKLLAKTAEERYQTAAGAARDLRRCFDEFESRGRIDEFRLGEQDIPDRLLIPETLYGRESEINALLASFDRAVAGGRPELVLVSGYAGVGKSSVVNELHKRLAPSRGLFASGKFDQFKPDVPYATLAQAFLGLLRPVLTKSEAELCKWRGALCEALNPNGQLIVDLVPELELIIGKQPPVPAVLPQDVQVRFQLVVRRFVSVFARPEHPLVLFLDDLQWLDTATMDLLQDFLTQSDVQHLLLIGAYRDNEITPAHPLIRKLEAIQRVGGTVHEISLSPLTLGDLQQLVADSLHCEPEPVASLVNLIHEKTAGNPFFAIQFISTLGDEGLLRFNHDKGRWSWDLGDIHAKGYTDNVVDLMVGKLSRLPIETQSALQQFAYLGNSATLTQLQLVSDASTEQIHAQLWDAIRAGMIIHSGDYYRFAHDRVQEAAYSLIPEELRSETHLRIGRMLTAHTSPADREERIFEIVSQFNRASHVIASVEERLLVAELNLVAGRRAKSSTAYALAHKFLAAGRAMLTEASWEEHYELIFSIESLMAECELLTADMEEAEKRLLMLAARANSARDLALVTRSQLTLHAALDRLDRGIEICLEYLRRDGMTWSAHPTSDEVQREYDRIWLLLGDRQIEHLVNEPLVTDPDILDILEVLTDLITPAVFFDRDLCALVICHVVNLSLEYGISDASCFAYVWFGIIAGPRFGKYEEAVQFGQLGYDLLGKRGLRRYEARTCMCFGSVVVPWSNHARCGRHLVRHAFDVAYKMGDFTYAAYSFTQSVTNFLVVGDPLAEVQTEAEKGIEFAKGARLGLVVDIITSDLQLIRTLRGLTNTFGSFNDKDFDEDEFERHLASNPALADPGFGYWALKAEARFFAGDYTSAVDASLRAKQLLWAAPSLLEPAAFRFYSALSHAASWDGASPSERIGHAEALIAHHRQLDILADRCPDNFDDRAALVGAEIARIEGRDFDAMRLYERAIRSAQVGGFVHNEALANEIAARFYVARGFPKIADAYLRDARYRYALWGADGKVKQLDKLYPHIKEDRPALGRANSIVAQVELLDLATIVKASQAVSGEIVPEKLIDTLMRAAIEHAGAERGLLILPGTDEPQIEAEATTSGDDVLVHLRDASSAAPALPKSIVRYVMRTQENVILEDASSENPFSADPYIVQHHARSMLCLPLINQAKFAGVLYLENNLTPQVFTPDRITVLKILASQAAISLENTRLYRDLENREARIRRLVDANIIGIVTWNVDGAIVGSNEAFLHMVQYSREDVAAGRTSWRDMTPAEWHESDERALAKLGQTGIVEPYEKELCRKDGSRVPILMAAALFEEGGKEGVAFALDLSAQKRADEALRRSESYLTEAQRLTHSGTWAFSPSNPDNSYWSSEYYRIYGFDPTKDAARNSTALERIHPDDRARRSHKFEEALITKEDFEDDFRIVLPDGTEKHLHMVAHPIVDQSGQVVELVGTSMDVTEQYQNRVALEKAFQEIQLLKDQLYKENLALRDEVDRASMFEEIVGASKPLKTVLSRIAKVASTDSTVIITGETGTGKELIARAIHKRSQRSGRAFVSVNCAALAPTLISSELFGHEKGAFTGATQRRLGRFELADGGTIFLDEVGELLPDTQVALLRVLQEREFERVGGGQTIHVDVRVIAATNRDLKAAIESGALRQDLFYRLNVFPIALPPLRERKDDILMLVEYFVQRYASRAGKNIRTIDKRTLDLFQSYEWPGNIRELQNVVERSVILTSGDVLSVDELWLSQEISRPELRVEVSASFKREGETWNEKELVEAALAQSRGRISGASGAATKLGIPPSTLDRKIKALKINKNQFKFG